MDKNAIKKYATWARRELISRVRQKAYQYGIRENDIIDANADSIDGKILTNSERRERRALIAQVTEKGFDQVMEEVAYTWFNRFSALRFMEVNGYLPTHVRVFTDEGNNFKPQIITEAIHMELDGLDMDKVYVLKEEDDSEELFKYLVITQCNALNEILPGMFQKIADYTELLFPDNLLREGSVIAKMITLIPEDDWKDAVQIIGWLYQYYNSEPKDVVSANMKKKIKITKEDIPAATQLFTPDWIVRYMVENSLGRLWMGGHPNEELKSKWYYYLDEIEQEVDVQEQLDKIREEYKNIKPEEIRVVDPCMGSGHILVYAFDVLMQIYEAYGFNQRDAAKSIVENNIFGLDIDERATQLAYFAVMMKARQYDRRFFSRKVQPHVYAICDSNHLDPFCVEYFLNGDIQMKKDMQLLIDNFRDAKEYGSITNITKADFDAMYVRFDELRNDISMYTEQLLHDLLPFIQVAEVMTQKYDVVITNPPYMKADNMPSKLSEYVLSYKASAKYDLYSAFIYKCHDFLKINGLMSMITMHNFMFAPSFLDLRDDVKSWDWINMLHLGSRAFAEISGEVVQTVAFVISKTYSNRNLYVVDVTDEKKPEKKELMFHQNKHMGYAFNLRNIDLIPAHAFGYSLSDQVIELYKNNQILGKYGVSKAGIVTGADDYFVKFWHEIDNNKITYSPQSNELYEYVLFSKGGTFTKWYGNSQNVLKLNDMWDNTKTNKSVRRGDIEFYYRRGIGWSQMGGGVNKAFSEIENCICKTNTPMFYPDDPDKYNYILGFLNSNIPPVILKALNPTLSILTSDILNLPFLYEERYAMKISELVEASYQIAKDIYTQREENWQFAKCSLLGAGLLQNIYDEWLTEITLKKNKMKAYSYELNKIFIKIMGLRDSIDLNEEDEKGIENTSVTIRRLISFAVGCMFGRYSIEKEGIAFAGGNWDSSIYRYYSVDADNIIPISDDEYFSDDIVGSFVKFIKIVYGAETMEENLKFIADALGGKGSPRDVIRSYFMNDFYNDHCKMYQKRPIYWLFDSGKKNGFKALIYMHRYQPDTIARMRTDYVHEQQERYRTAIAHLEERINNSPTSERVKLNKQLGKLKDQATEIRIYEEEIHHLADQMIHIDLDDGVEKNYEILKDVLAKIK